MTFDEWWSEQDDTQYDLEGDKSTARMVWEAAMRHASEICRQDATIENFYEDDADYDMGLVRGADACSSAILGVLK